MKVFDRFVWLWRRLDPLLPWPPTSIIAIGRSRNALLFPAPPTRATRILVGGERLALPDRGSDPGRPQELRRADLRGPDHLLSRNPEGFTPHNTRIYRVTDYRTPEQRRRLFAELKQNRYAILGMLCSAEPIMTKWKWALAARLPVKVFVLNENGDYFWLDWAT